MNIKPMLYVTAIAETGSLSAAGRKLGVSQPTLSVFLSELETNLGVDLFVRDKKRLIPTPAGNLYLDAARQMIRIKEQTYQTIHQLTHEPVQTITVGATPLRGSIITAQIFPQFSRRFPHVRLEIKEAYMNDLRALVKNGRVNYSLGSCYDSQDPDFDYAIISREEVVLAVPAFHRLAHTAGNWREQLICTDIRLFADTPFVLLSPGTTVRAISDNIFTKEDIQPTVVFETNNNLVASSMIRQGAGVGLLPRSSMVMDAEDIVYFSIQPRYYLGLCIIIQKNRRLSPAERYFIYLVINRDIHNPTYIPSPNEYARAIYREFAQEDPS